MKSSDFCARVLQNPLPAQLCSGGPRLGLLRITAAPSAFLPLTQTIPRTNASAAFPVAAQAFRVTGTLAQLGARWDVEGHFGH